MRYPEDAPRKSLENTFKTTLLFALQLIAQIIFVCYQRASGSTEVSLRSILYNAG